jgi:hypothetical protein
VEKCRDYGCYVGYTFRPRNEQFDKYYLEDLMLSFDHSVEDKIDRKFDFCPDCGNEILWHTQ